MKYRIQLLSNLIKTNLKILRRYQSTSMSSIIINIAAKSLRGRSHKNEDRFHFERLLSNVNYMSIFDGHNGYFVSEFINTNMPLVVKDKLKDGDLSGDDIFKTVENILFHSFDHCQDLLKVQLDAAKGLKRKDMIGSTAVVALLINQKYLSIANVGDSKAILCRDGSPIELTIEHIPDNKEETKRIEATGGWIDWNGQLKPLVSSRLSMTRSFGNLLLKPTGVISEPTVKHIVIDSVRDSFIVLCSDGITHSMTNEEIVFVIGHHEEAKAAAIDLTTTAQQYGSEDDVTAVVLQLPAWGHREIKNVNDYSMFRTMTGARSGG